MFSRTPLALLMGMVFLTGCPDDDTTPADTESTGTAGDDGDGDGSPTTTPPATTMPPPTTTMGADTTGTPMTDDGMDTTGTPMTDDGATDTGGESGTTAGDTGTESGDTGTMNACAEEVLSNTLPATVTGTTVGSGNELTPACSEGDDEDRVFEFTAPADGDYLFDTFGSEIDTILSIYPSCDGEPLRCSDDAGKTTLQSAAAINLNTDDTVLVVVDGYDESGNFTLNASTLPQICAFSGDPLAVCADTATGGEEVQDTLDCDDSGDFYFDIYEVTVSAGDCLYVSADNIGAGGATGETAADLWMLVVDDDNGNFLYLEDDMDCTDPTFNGAFGCPEGGGTVTNDGTMLIGVAQHGGAGCPDDAPYTLTVSINGVDIDPGPPVSDDEANAC